MTSRKIRILYLTNDLVGLLYPALAQVSVSHDVHFEWLEEVKDLGNPNVYTATPEVCEQIARLTQKQEVDLVIIMNNRGAGLTKAQAVDPQMRTRTIVVWGLVVRGAEAYKELGILHLGHQSDLPSLIIAALGLTA